MKNSGESSSAALNLDQRYENWKSLVPVLYECFSTYNLVWPSLSVRWGPQCEQGTYANRQLLYLSEQTDGSMPSTLIVASCEVGKPRVAAAEHKSQFNEEERSSFVKKLRTIIHPGEVNRIRQLPLCRTIVATHTDSPDVLLWNLAAQPDRQPVIGASESIPDVILTGHTENATEFALAMRPVPAEPFLTNFRRDNNVVMWSIQDALTFLHMENATTYWRSGNSGSSSSTKKEGLKLGPFGIFRGHDAAVEDVQFCPSSAAEFCSVGDDSCLIFWDVRVGNFPVVKAEKAHKVDIRCVDWNAHDTNLILTGSSDNTVYMFDRRKFTAGHVASPIHKFQGHTAPFHSIQWCPDRASVFASAAEDGMLNIWDYDKVGKNKKTERATARPAPPGLFFQHGGHRDKIVDFHWNFAEPWTIASVSADAAGGGTLQIWRMSDLLYRPEEEVKADLTKFKEHLTKSSPSEASESSN